MASEAGGSGDLRCRFCGRSGSRQRPLVSGPLGPICAGCVETGLALVRAGGEHPGNGAGRLVRLRGADEVPCEFCERAMRLSFFGFRRPLSRMACMTTGAVVCADCLEQKGKLINNTIGGRLTHR